MNKKNATVKKIPAIVKNSSLATVATTIEGSSPSAASRHKIVIIEPIEATKPLALALEDVTLTPRQTAVLQQLATGLTDPEIATVLDIEPSTVQYHIQKIRDKVGAETRHQLITWAWQMLPDLQINA